MCEDFFFSVCAMTFYLQCGDLFSLQCVGSDLFCFQSGIVCYVKSKNLFCLQCTLFWELSNSL